MYNYPMNNQFETRQNKSEDGPRGIPAGEYTASELMDYLDDNDWEGGEQLLLDISDEILGMEYPTKESLEQVRRDFDVTLQNPSAYEPETLNKIANFLRWYADLFQTINVKVANGEIKDDEDYTSLRNEASQLYREYAKKFDFIHF